MLVKFIAHAGVYIEEGHEAVLIDPWFSDSTTTQPLMQSIGGGHTTIDFQIPPANIDIGALRPDLILISHFHAHHSNRNDILALVAQSSDRAIRVAYPDLPERDEQVRAALEPFPSVAASKMISGDVIDTGTFEIKCFAHTVRGHLAWLVRSATGAALHIADAALNRDNSLRTLDPVWDSFANLCPDLVFVSAGGNSVRKVSGSTRYLSESVTLSPIEAAQLLETIRPRASTLIGCYNHSVWRSRVEFIPPSSLIEEQFEWAHSWLLPDARFVRARPGHTFGIGDPQLAMSVDTFI